MIAEGFEPIGLILPSVLKEISRRAELRLRLEAECRPLADEEFLKVVEVRAALKARPAEVDPAELRLIGKCLLSEQLVANLQPTIALMEADWRRLRFTMDPLTEALFRQIHELLAKLYEAHVFPGEGRRS